MYKVCFIGGGRRISLAELFIAKGYRVYSYELDQCSAIAKVANLIGNGLPWDAPNIREDIVEAVLQHDIDIILPLDDAATSIVASISDPSVNYRKVTGPLMDVQACHDKSIFEKVVLNSTLKYIYPKAVAGEGVIYKPIKGFGSRGIFREDSYDDTSDIPTGFIAQKLITGGREYSVDSYWDKYNQMVYAVPRLRLRVANGEVIDSITIKNDKLINFVKELGKVFLLQGPQCTQFISDAEENYYIFESNYRAGGGITLSIQAGMDVVDMMTREYILHDTINSNMYLPYEINLLMKRATRDFFFD